MQLLVKITVHVQAILLPLCLKVFLCIPTALSLSSDDRATQNHAIKVHLKRKRASQL